MSPSMTGDKGSRRLIKFWWALFATTGALGGASSVVFFGSFRAIWGILGIGLPISAAIAVLEWRAERRSAVRRPWAEAKPNSSASRRAYTNKQPPRRGQLHAISRRKTIEPPSPATPDNAGR